MSDVADHKPWWLQPLAEPQAEEDSGVTIKIVTGDSELVTQHVCAQRL
jgi:hypothetical protein